MRVPETIEEPVDQLQAPFRGPKRHGNRVEIGVLPRFLMFFRGFRCVLWPILLVSSYFLVAFVAGEGPGRRAVPALAAVLGASLLGSCPGEAR